MAGEEKRLLPVRILNNDDKKQYMISAPELQSTARHIARSAQQKIKNTTGMRVALLLYPKEHTTGTPEYMLHKIAESLEMSPKCFRMRTRKRDVVELRFIGALFLRNNFPQITLCQIANLFGGLDHSSVINGVARANELLYSQDLRFLKKYNTALKSVHQWLRREESVFASAYSA